MASKHDYLAVLQELPARQAGLLFEQMQQAAMLGTAIMRASGMTLPGASDVPTVKQVHDHVWDLVNGALDSYHIVARAQPQAKSNEVWGEDGSNLFSVTVTGLDTDPKFGFTAEIDFNLLYDL